jgi:hypothetical protein
LCVNGACADLGPYTELALLPKMVPPNRVRPENWLAFWFNGALPSICALNGIYAGEVAGVHGYCIDTAASNIAACYARASGSRCKYSRGRC